MSRTATRHSNHSPLVREVEQLKEDLVAIKSDVGHLAGRLLSSGHESAAAARDAIEENVKSWVRGTRKEIGHRPLTSLAVAAGAGLVLGWWFSRG